MSKFDILCVNELFHNDVDGDGDTQEKTIGAEGHCLFSTPTHNHLVSQEANDNSSFIPRFLVDLLGLISKHS